MVDIFILAFSTRGKFPIYEWAFMVREYLLFERIVIFVAFAHLD